MECLRCPPTPPGRCTPVPLESLEVSGEFDLNSDPRSWALEAEARSGLGEKSSPETLAKNLGTRSVTDGGRA